MQHSTVTRLLYDTKALAIDRPKYVARAALDRLTLSALIIKVSAMNLYVTVATIGDPRPLMTVCSMPFCIHTIIVRFMIP